MKNKLFLTAFIILLVAEILTVALFLFSSRSYEFDPVAANEIVQSVAESWHDMSSHKNLTAFDYAVIDNDENCLFKTRDGLSQTVFEATRNRDLMLDVVVDGEIKGKAIIHNDYYLKVVSDKRLAACVFFICMFLQLSVCIMYAVYIRITVLKPFGKLKGFAERVARGNLDVPLEMDKKNLFGSFTESFDIMRTELKKARLAQARAEESKKELVAELSHDIKTPVSGIKAVAEIGIAVSENEKERLRYSRIVEQADRIDALVTNLFAATLEELEKLTVSPADMPSSELCDMIKNSDYFSRTEIPDIPECLIYADKMRLRQVFDNIFANSYKYADTEIFTTAHISDGKLRLRFEDCGGGVDADELPLLKQKFKRGRNAANVEGAGLGLFVSDYFMKSMRGELLTENGKRGLAVTVAIPLAGELLG